MPRQVIVCCLLVWGLAACGDDGGGANTDGSSSACSFQNCTGCCDGDRCVPTTSDDFCGSPGSACQACSGTDRCYAGNCLPVTDCTNCDGCCLDGTQCVPGNTNLACGSNGGACSPCSSGQGCNPDTGACEALACDDTNCPNGCCTANGQCINYGEQTTSVCGEAGAACTVCPGGTLSCTEGTCIMDQPCFEFCENGCCTANGQCIPFASQEDNQCGGDGPGSELCAACSGDLSCVNGACVTDPVYRVVIVSAVIAQNKSGTPWDSVVFTNPLPDPYVGFALATDTFLDGFTPTIDNTITPNWNHAIGNYLGSELVSEGLGFNVRDSDGLGVFETIGACSHSVTAGELASGTKTFATCGQYVMNLRVNFVLQ